jgi:hypothetical protein
MKANSVLWLLMLVLGLFGSSWAQFPCYPGDSVGTDCCGADSSCYIGECGYSLDLGSCDTLHVVPWPKTDTCFISCFMGNCDTICINDPGEHFPCFLYVNLFVTHDSNTFWWQSESKWIQDSIAAFVVPLAWTCTNPAVYCSLSGHWNENAMSPYDPRFPRSIWRHFHPSELDSNRMAWLAGKSQGLEWSTTILNMTSDSSWYYFVRGVPPHAQDDSVYTPPRMWLTMVPFGLTNRRWWEGDRTLLTTFTFRLEDSTTICIDSTFWPPLSRFKFSRMDGILYFPRSNLPVCFQVHDDTVEVPPTGVRWIEGSTEEESRQVIFSISQNYPNPFNPITEFKLSLPRASHVRMQIFNILGQKVRTLVDGDLAAGEYVVDWDGVDERGKEVSSGIYFYRMTADDFSDVGKMVLLK